MDESKIIFYHQATCPMCAGVERMLKSKGIQYESCMDVKEMTAAGVIHTPTLEVDGQRLTTGHDIFAWINSNGGANE